MTKNADPDRHRNRGILIRPDPEVRDPGIKILKENDWSMNEFVEACLDVLAQNPEALLKRLSRVRRARKPGRPPKSKT